MDNLIQIAETVQRDYGHLIRPLIVGTLVSIVCSVIGCFIVLRRMAFLADAIAHAMLAGVIAGYLIVSLFFGTEGHLGAMLLGALLAGIATVAIIGFVTRFSRVKQDTATGIMYTGIFALGSFVISIRYFSQRIHVDIYHYIVGSVLAVPDEELWLLAIVTSIVVSVVILFYRALQLTSFDPVMAASIGVPVLAVEYLLTACTSLVVVSGVQIAGVILVVALIITPAATAYLLTDRLHRMILLAAIIGVVGFWLGFLLATIVGASPGPSVVVTMTSLFLGAWVFAPRYGLLADSIRRRSAVPQEIMEDVLGSILRAKGKLVPIQEIVNRVGTPQRRIRRAIQMLARQNLVDIEGGNQVRLTPDGRFEAVRLVRAHRLWETYLQKTGVPEAEIHERAHQLEHITDQATAEYLDDKLGHPLKDPHGSEIPPDTIHVRTDQDIIFSLLREGDHAEIRKIGSLASGSGLEPGDLIRVGARSADGTIWSLTTSDGRQIEFDHRHADDVIVRLRKPDSDEC